jgi:glutathione S-transferase
MTLPRVWSFSTSPFAGKVRLVFAEKGVDYELHEIHPAKRPPRLRELTPLGRVPVLETPEGVAIFESSVIVEWIEETYPEPALWPAHPSTRGWARAWAKWIDDHVTANYFLGMRKLAFGKAPDDPEDITAQLHAKCVKRLGTLEETLAVHDGPWVCGEEFTYADLYGMAVAVRLPVWTPDLVAGVDALPNVSAWFEQLRARPTVAALDAKGEPVHSA